MLNALLLALGGGLVTTVLALLFQRSKAKSAEALLRNLATKEDQLKDDKELAKNQGLLEAEEKKREALSNKETKDASTKDLIDFINDVHKR